MKVLPVHSPDGRIRIWYAASAMISGLRATAVASSPPTMFATAAVAISVRGHKQLAAMPSARRDSATPMVRIVIAYLLTVYGAWAANHLRSMFSGGARVRTCGLSDFARWGNARLVRTN